MHSDKLVCHLRKAANHVGSPSGVHCSWLAIMSLLAEGQPVRMEPCLASVSSISHAEDSVQTWLPYMKDSKGTSIEACLILIPAPAFNARCQVDICHAKGVDQVNIYESEPSAQPRYQSLNPAVLVIYISTAESAGHINGGVSSSLLFHEQVINRLQLLADIG